jgi:hypothetical protein
VPRLGPILDEPIEEKEKTKEGNSNIELNERHFVAILIITVIF